MTQKDTRDLPDEKATNYRYDLQNTLISVTKDSVKTTFDYLPDGLRWKKTSGSKVTQYSYNGANQVIGDQTSNGTISSYIRGDRVLVKKDLTNQKDYYYLYNGHGDVVQMVGTDGSLVNSYQYDEWGNLTQQKETVANEFKYAGETYDAETGLYYLKARYYDPNLGRFLNEDTVEGQIDNPLSMNIYGYVNNNPLRYTDPTGNKEFEITPENLPHAKASPDIDLESPSYWDGLKKRADAIKSKATRLFLFKEVSDLIVKEGVKDEISDYIWNNLSPTQRGELIEEILSNYDYKDWYHIGKENGGYYKEIDFMSDDREIVSLKTIDPRNYSKTQLIYTLSENLRSLKAFKIKIGGELVSEDRKRLDIRVPKGYKEKIDVETLISKAGSTLVVVEEF